MASLAKRLGRWLPSPYSVRVQILSDLHLEIGQQYASYKFPASAPLLLLGGDIGRLVDYEAYRTFLEAQTRRYERVLLVLGNHEFYGMDYDSGIGAARQLAAEPSLAGRLTLLHETRWDDPGSPLTVLGCTLWSKVPETPQPIVQSKVNDFRHIGNWSVQRHNEAHEREVTWLRKQVAQVTSEGARKLLVATHHASCIEGTSRPEHGSNPWSSAFATDLFEQEGWAGVSAWAFGHTHYCADFVKNGVRVVANQRGYVYPDNMLKRDGRNPSPTETGFDKAFKIQL
ncbi:Ser/Thr protein phosphatase [Colletotrichum sojae]|uniref:Ser/Thr protein phosphatase n=1 Tax=Colletotrichum sojae TaxID=2175907 RepID=A0A8H6J3T4_9PEZI|nr:Ser/Thr protein phosphatase [Colletotrichum sojae]